MSRKSRDSDLPIRLTRVNRRRLLVLLADAANVGGGTIWHLAGGSSARVWFGFLDKLEDAGLVTGEWEAPRTGWSAPSEQDSPRRRFYRLTPEGRAQAMQALDLKEGDRACAGDDEEAMRTYVFHQWAADWDSPEDAIYDEQ
jgi:hypothetical protein